MRRLVIRELRLTHVTVMVPVKAIVGVLFVPGESFGVRVEVRTVLVAVVVLP
jgi:hypothetical protein